MLFMKGSLPAQRFLTAVQMQRPELTESLSRELWMRIWHRVITSVLSVSFIVKMPVSDPLSNLACTGIHEQITYLTLILLSSPSFQTTI